MTTRARTRSASAGAGAFAIFAAYIVAFIPLGYLLSTFLFLVAMTTYVDREAAPQPHLRAVFSPVVYALFTYGLGCSCRPGTAGLGPAP